MRTLLKHVLRATTELQGLHVAGWVRTRRDAKTFSFLELNDGSCLKNLQVIVDSSLPNYAETLRWLGFSDDDLAGEGSNRLVDALVAWGDAGSIRARVLEHLQAGADHVCIQPVGGSGDHLGLAQLRELAPALLEGRP